VEKSFREARQNKNKNRNKNKEISKINFELNIYSSSAAPVLQIFILIPYWNKLVRLSMESTFIQA
jgi:hypothetical protein